MSVEHATAQEVKQRMDEMGVQLDLMQTVVATMFAAMLRTASEGQHRRLLEEVRQNILLTARTINPNAAEAAVLSYEERTDRLLDEITRISRTPPSPKPGSNP